MSDTSDPFKVIKSIRYEQNYHGNPGGYERYLARRNSLSILAMQEEIRNVWIFKSVSENAETDISEDEINE